MITAFARHQETIAGIYEMYADDDMLSIDDR
jgi:hypothetical protein